MSEVPGEPADASGSAAALTATAVEPGTEIPPLHVGPLSVVDLVRWAGYQENWLRIHYDREEARTRRGLPDIVQSGHHRTALLARMLTDWMGEQGELRRLQLRHSGLVRPGETVTCRGRVTQVEATAGGMRVSLEVWCVRQDGAVVSEGRAGGFFGFGGGGLQR